MSVPVGSHIQNPIKKELAKKKRDTCRYYSHGNCLIRKKLVCSICRLHKKKEKLAMKLKSN